MGANSAISWTDHTFNPWLGCTKVSPACQHCYAEAWAKRSGLVKWGDSAERRRTSESYWRQPLKWDREAAKAGGRRRVFCASLADVFEDREELKPWRRELFELIKATSNLDWLLLTKRPENINRLSDGMPKTVWLGTTVESKDYLKRVADLVDCGDCAVRFLSCEPLLGEVDLRTEYFTARLGEYPFHGISDEYRTKLIRLIDWVIVGGESGAGHRPLNLEHVRGLRDECARAGVPFFFKQHGGRTPTEGGCLLDGREWKEFPKAA